MALVGTNGAGKSTLLRVISGLGVATRGVVRLDGRTITDCDPELRARIGIVQLMGGNAVFASLSVVENLRLAGFLSSAPCSSWRWSDACSERLGWCCSPCRALSAKSSASDRVRLANTSIGGPSTSSTTTSNAPPGAVRVAPASRYP